mgnify:CR=1 FL=1
MMDENHAGNLVIYLEELGWARPKAQRFAKEHVRAMEEAKHKPKCTECGIWHDNPPTWNWRDNQWKELCNECKKYEDRS